MLLTRFRSLMLVLGLLGGSSAAVAQPASPSHLPFPPPGLSQEHDYQLFAPADLSTYGTTPRQAEGVFFRYDRLRWLVSGPKGSTIGNESAETPILLQNNGRVFNGQDHIGPTDPITGDVISNFGTLYVSNINSLDTSFIQTDWAWGNRYELGYMKDDRGWMATYYKLNNANSSITQVNGNIAFNDPAGLTRRFLDLNGDEYDDDFDGDGIFGNTRPYNYDAFVFIDTDGDGTPERYEIGRFVPGYGIVDADGILDSYAGPDSDDLVFFPVTFNVLRVINTTRVSNVELMHLMRWDRLHDGSNAEWMIGLRYTSINDDFWLQGTNSGGSVKALTLRSNINNYIVGPQVGFRWNKEQGPWQLNTELRAAAGANFQKANLRGAFASESVIPLDAADPLAGVNFLSIQDTESSVQFSPLGEIRLDIGYRVTKAINLRFGYTGTVIGGVTRASRRINYELPGTDPSNGYNTRGIQINDEHRLEPIYFSGINFGIEINR